jgi:3-hydroxybutyryl-CoA dehydrogenase
MRVAMVGAGTMGRGIAQDFARAGYEVALHDISSDNLSQAREYIARSLADQAQWGLFPHSEIEAALSRIVTTTSLPEAACEADLIIEAVFEDLALKRDVFRDLDCLCPPRTILASNTSSYMPSLLAAATQRSDRVLVVHYFYPPPLMPVVELVRAATTSDDTLRVVYDAVKSTGKSPIVVQREVPGFIANRMQAALLREALSIVAQGIATAQDVDTAVKQGFGRRLAIKGPIEMAEVQDGWDVIQTIAQAIQPDLDTSASPSPIIAERIERGELGPRTGKGFYAWPAGAKDEWEKTLFTSLASFARK